MSLRRADDLSRFREVPDLPALAGLRRRPSVWGAFRAAWTPQRTILVAALSPIAFWVYAGLGHGLATAQPAWGVLVALMAVGATFTMTTYLGRGAASGGACGVAPLAWLGLAGWLLVENPTLLGALFGVAMVTVAALQRVTRPAC